MIKTKKRLIILALLYLLSLDSTAQSRELLQYFIQVKNDSIINTDEISLRSANLCSRFEDNNVPDSIALKYFFGNNTKNLYFESELYNSDENTYSYETFKKIVCPLFLKPNEEKTFLLCYQILNIIYLSFYDATGDTLGPTYIVGDYSHYIGEQITSSIIFSNGKLATIEVTDKGSVYYKLLYIDENCKLFNLIKSIEVNSIGLSEKEKYDKLYTILGINEKGEQIQ